jgi:hypothetical protein
MPVISRANIAKQLEPGLNKILGDNYNYVDKEHLPLFDIENSKKAFEEEVMMDGLGQAYVKAEGEAIQYDDIQESYTARYNHETIALGIAFTEEAFEDEQYGQLARRKTKALGRAMAHTKEEKAASVYNNGFSTSFLGGDGQPLFSASHPGRTTAAQSNTVAADLSETAIENALIAIRGFKDDRGLPIVPIAQSLHVPNELQFVAKKILQSEMSTVADTFGTDGITNTNKINAVRNVFPKGFFVNIRFTDPNAWFIRTNVSDGLKMFNRVGLSQKMEGDFDTGNIRYKARERYSFGWSDWRGAYGSSGSS